MTSNASAYGTRLVPDQNKAPVAVLESGGLARTASLGASAKRRSNNASAHATHFFSIAFLVSKTFLVSSAPGSVAGKRRSAAASEEASSANASASRDDGESIDRPSAVRKNVSRRSRTVSFFVGFRSKPSPASSPSACDAQAARHPARTSGSSTKRRAKRSRAHCAQCGNVCGKFPTTQDGNEGESDASRAPETDQGAVRSTAATYVEYAWFSTPASIRLNRWRVDEASAARRASNPSTPATIRTSNCVSAYVCGTDATVGKQRTAERSFVD